MPPNIVESHFPPDPEIQNAGQKSTENLIDRSDSDFKLKVFNIGLNFLAHALILFVVIISLYFAFRNGVPVNTTSLHIILCVIGYQLLMAQAILSLSPHNIWSSYILNLKLIHQRRVHWVLQILGSGLAIAGSFIKIVDNSVHWFTLHGQFALVALVFTVVCFFNGLSSNYAYELRKFIPSNLSKLTHICFGVVAFAAASISLCYGFDKNMFRNWADPWMTPTVIAFTSTFTAIIILNPLIVFGVKSWNIIKR